MLNVVTIAGRCTREIELRYTQSQKAVASFTLACERDFAPTGEKKEVDYVNCVAWGKTGEIIHQYATKGSMLMVSGRLQSREWTDKNDNKRREWEVIADHVYFGESKKTEQKPVNVAYDEPTTGGAFAELTDSDGELPFD